MAGLTGQTVADSYEQLLIVADGGLTSSLQAIQDGDGGITSCLKIARNKLEVIPDSADDGNLFEVSQYGGASILNVASNTPAITIGVDDTGADFRVYSATTNEGLFYDASEDELGLLLTTKLKFHDIGGGEEIYASANGHLEINADTTLDITAPTVDINASTAVTIAGNTTMTTADNTDTLTLISTDADATSGPNLRLYRNSGSAANDDVLGRIDFEGKNGAGSPEDVIYANIQAEIMGTTDDSEQGQMQFGVMVAGTLRNALMLDRTEVAINDDSVDMNFRVASDNLTHALFVQGSDGNVGIGTSGPACKLEITADVGSDPTSTNDFIVTASNTSSGSGFASVFKASLNQASPGTSNHWFAAYDSDALQWTVRGDASGGAEIHDASDRRMKKGIVDISNALDLVHSLKPRNFNWKVSSSGSPKKYGFIADEYAEVFPDSVSGERDAVDEDGKIIRQSITMKPLYAVLTKAIQELSAKVTALENA